MYTSYTNKTHISNKKILIFYNYINACTKSHITPLTSIHSLYKWSSISHKLEIVTCNNKEFTA